MSAAWDLLPAGAALAGGRPGEDAHHGVGRAGAAAIRARRGRLDLGSEAAATAAAKPSSPLDPLGLTARELEVLRLVAGGKSKREIAASLFISEHTAANHLRTILRKTACKNRTDAASYAYRHGLIESDRR